jgi:superfamily II DNA or RNA helicase
MIKLRPYQLKIIHDLRSQMRIGHNRMVMTSPTGSG